MIDISSRIYRILFPSVTFSTNDERIHLTFDDGPHPVATPIVLGILNKFSIKATFFLIGHHVQQSPELARNINAEGHTVGNHSFNHLNLVFRQKDFIRRDISATNDIIGQTTGVRPTLFRPPFGFFDLRILSIVESLGMRLVHWSNDLRDFETRTTEKNIANAVRRINRGSIILLHDNEFTVGKISTILPTILMALQDRGLVFDSLH
jgi:peptidoglycan/xylan/chitin deacetylase (PgdA/CDA1 family)